MLTQDFLTIVEFAVKMNLHPNTIRKFIKIGKIHAINMGMGKKKTYRIPLTEIERMSLIDLREALKNLKEEELKK